MTRTLVVIALALVLVMALAVPAFAVSGADGAGRNYAKNHVVVHAQAGAFSGEMNPGVMHKGFSGFAEHHDM